jgi:hypothetical protein
VHDLDGTDTIEGVHPATVKMLEDLIANSFSSTICPRAEQMGHKFII